MFENWFRSEAIKKKNPATVKCDAFQINIYSKKELAVASMTSRFGVAIKKEERRTSPCVFQDRDL